MQPKASGRGCLFWGAIVSGALFVCFLLLVVAAYCLVLHLVHEYTDTKPIQVAVTPLSDADTKTLQDRVQNFNKALTNNIPVGPLTLTADEINALILKQNKAPETLKLYFTLNENHVQAQLSVSTDNIGFWPIREMLSGRYFNGSGDFQVSLHDGQLTLNIQSLAVKGKPLPDEIMQPIRAQNFADILLTNGVGFSNALQRLQEIKVEDGKLLVIPKTPEPEAVPKLESGK